MAIALLESSETPSIVPESGSRRRSVEKARIEARGKFLFAGAQKFYACGVTYGTFAAGADGSAFPSPRRVQADFAQMAASAVTALRVYTPPPRWLLDYAEHHGLRVLVGLPWEQHVAFLGDRSTPRAIERRLRAQIRECGDHPAILAYAIGNEIPASIVRWHGRERIERFLERLYDVAKEEACETLVTYVNFPSTEYLQLPFLDLVAFNVYLETPGELTRYLARLQNIAGDRPLLLAEIGLDSRRNGEERQAQSLNFQLATAFGGGCAGAFVFAWTDEWHRGGHAIDDWDFGITDRQRRPKPALDVVRNAFRDIPFPRQRSWPRVSVVVCSFNGARTLRQCLEGLSALRYPNYEVIVVNDGSTDATASIAADFPFRLITTTNRGLSSARNTGLAAATGEIVAYIDDDAYPDPHWLSYLAATFQTTDHAGVGGPNLPPASDGPVAEAVANAPGGPIHVLLSDAQAEHIPGCNMAFRKAALEEIGGFDPQFRVAGDDVHVCWLLAERGKTLGFSPAALVWHHRRNSVRAYFRQQRGYGRAEALLERRWPEKYNVLGHPSWGGRVYGKAAPQFLSFRRPRVYCGTWGSALFQSLYEPAPGLLSSLALMPEYYLLLGVLAVFTALGAHWRPLLLLSAPLALCVAVLLVQSLRGGARASATAGLRTRRARARLFALTTLLYLLQPLARLSGRLKYGLTPWRHAARALAAPWPRTVALWSEEWRGVEERLRSLEIALQAAGARLRRGGDYDRWDLEVQGGLFGSARLQMAIEEHGSGKQLIRLRLWPRCHALALVAIAPMCALAYAAALDRAWSAATACALVAVVLTLRAIMECAAATGVARETARQARSLTVLPESFPDMSGT